MLYVYPTGKAEKKQKIPTFVISMTARDASLLEAVVDKLGIKTKIYIYPPRNRPDGYKRLGMAVLLVRGMVDIKNIIIPMFYKKLHGYKGWQFKIWLEKIGSDELVPERFKFVHKLYKLGFYEKTLDKFTDC